jgi:Predicted permease
MGSKVSWLFVPIRQFLSIIGLPVILAGVFYYLLNPLVNRLERKMKVNRTLTITGVFIVVIVLLGWGIWSVIPIINQQLRDLIAAFPNYIDEFNRFVNGLNAHPLTKQFQGQVNHFSDLAAKELSQRSSDYIKTTVNSLGNVLGTMTTVVVALITMPFILFYYFEMAGNYLITLPNLYLAVTAVLSKGVK